jgi:hypothetical protein
MGGRPAQPVTIDGVAYASLCEASRQLGLGHITLRNRLRRGLPTEQVVSVGSTRQYKRKKYCKRGHLLELTGRIVDVKGYIARQCRICATEMANERYHRAHPDARRYQTGRTT